jgi:hypothetical protein
MRISLISEKARKTITLILQIKAIPPVTIGLNTHMKPTNTLYSHV